MKNLIRIDLITLVGFSYIVREMIFLVVVFILMFAIIVAVGYLITVEKVLKGFKVERMLIEGGTMLYIQYEGNYHKLVPTVEKVKADLQSFLEEKVIKLGGRVRVLEQAEMRLAGIYYDDPSRIKDVNKSRAVLGFFLPSRLSKNETELFTSYFTAKSYGMRKFLSLKAIGSAFDLFGFFSLLSAVIRGYPAIKHALIKEQEEALCSLEIYEWKRQKLTICFLLGDKHELLYLSDKPTPEYDH